MFRHTDKRRTFGYRGIGIYRRFQEKDDIGTVELLEDGALRA